MYEVEEEPRTRGRKRKDTEYMKNTEYRYSVHGTQLIGWAAWRLYILVGRFWPFSITTPSLPNGTLLRKEY